MTRTLLLLDVDGVVSPMRSSHVTPAGDEVEHWIVIPPRPPLRVRIRPAVIEAVDRWADSAADVQWLSSWGWRTKWLDQVGLPRLPGFYDPDPAEVFFWGRSQRPWKRPALEDYLAAQTETVRLAWVDDELFYYRGGETRKDMLAAHPGITDLLLVEPDGLVGLSDREIRKVDKFLSR
ncbi:HAD domain-containing protein [Arthrobacter sp. PAMC25284]|uniref:HAD domain-containing protein n=1 Tax=Arthrobacter sp. PAMC25284 TaxID=2861279 RepID=UPI001C62FC13|nr:HAD domain-containing protein [Arthrobacter sp. PAMC25284]QYF88477.1 hypothetical protein KY499_09255 [Arthrobacter sp. PAMC25284]